MALLLFDDYEALVVRRIPLIDLRAPVEFAKGAFPTAVNLPLMSDEERKEVGICYKHHGNAAAVALGHRLVSGAVKEARMEAWISFVRAHPDAMLYCFRGGQRSRITQEWLHEAGYTIPRIKGGYKAFRRYLIEWMERTHERFVPLLLGGRTGSGKTRLLKDVDAAVDLEGIAHHRGSAFGRHIDPQPTQIAFEDALGFALIEQVYRGYRTLLFEDEGRNIGRLYLPEKLAEHIGSGKLLILQTPMPERVEITLDEYVTQAQQEYAARWGVQEGLHKWAEAIRQSLDRIRKRLGSQRHHEIGKQFAQAYEEQLRTGDTALHRLWIEALLRGYYDPMYDYQLSKREERILFRGNRREILEWIETHIA